MFKIFKPQTAKMLTTYNNENKLGPNLRHDVYYTSIIYQRKLFYNFLLKKINSI